VLTRAGAILGTPGYMAPEILREGPAGAGPEADVYALGIIAYQTLTGERPVLALTDSAAARTEPTPPSRRVDGVPADLDVVIALALARDPLERYQSAAELGADLIRALDGTLSTVARKRAAEAGPMLDETLVAS
jgi:serine/threonine-protein kinase